jgi:hydrogenase-4 component B
MSGVMIKTGIYMMIRIFLDLMQPVPVWWGLLILIIGSISSLFGVLFALTEHDIKKLLAYHSIENIGIILLGLGSSLTFTSLNMPGLALLSLTASLFHTLNHATFKSLLFMGAGAVINETHTRNMEEYGGLIKYMPQTALFFLVGSMAISALPPFNGFFSEWLTYQALFQGIFTLNPTIKWVFIFATGSLAFTGGLALACFVKAFGATFLARSRSEEKHQIKEAPLSLRVGMGGLALITLILGIFSGKIIFLAQKNVHLSSSVSAPNFFVSFLAITLAIIIIVRYLINKNQKEVVGSTWDCGTTLGPRMEITATGFARSIILIFKEILKPTIQHDVEYHDSENRYLPKSKLVTLKVHDVHHSYFYQPLKQIINIISFKIKKTQSGITNAYILYIFIALIVALFFIL